MVPAADVWSRLPQDRAAPADEERETQVLFGEEVVVHETQGDWVKIEALEQPEFTHRQAWEGYPGWVHKSALRIDALRNETGAVVISSWTSITEPESAPHLWIPLGSLIRPMARTRDWYVVSTFLGDRCVVMDQTRSTKPSKGPLRHQILSAATVFLGVPYLWGGLTAGDPPPPQTPSVSTKHGVDCSGLVHLAYRACGLKIPRDSHEQWMRAIPLERKDLRPADLIFYAQADKPKKITHVALYTGYDGILESPHTGLTVRKISFKEKFGEDMIKVRSGDRLGERVIYFGRLVKD